ncbi:hypothetical protein BUALT_Bualt11G0071800 [Buddleja alternifolia]|uniref:SWIM-type domain-containing protein n=1 Tax=Buddleja alternifolia TaxID=168488 RepID=A0AAV6X3V1_9LAMI|nr:hypothetical protein BUALT_Bualt11G0071800 [Buddleja alternifolia]
MPDKQKGLIQAFEGFFPDSEHRFCVGHLLCNFVKVGFRGLLFKNALWKAANATTPNEFSRFMEEMNNLSNEAAEWFNDKPPQHWSRAFFSTDLKCDMLLNNGCEYFNNNILHVRELPVLSMLEWIMEFYDMHYLVRSFDGTEQHTVDLENYTCRCRKWDISGIPCKHACSAITFQGLQIEEFVYKSYRVDTYLEVYSPAIMSINGRNAPLASTSANPTDSVSTTAQKKLKVRKRKVTSVRPHQEGQSSKVAFMGSTNTINKGATKAAKKQKTVSSSPSTSMSTKTIPPLKKNLKKADSGLESSNKPGLPSNKPGLQLRDESDVDNINLEAPDFVAISRLSADNTTSRRPSATTPKKAKAPIPTVPKRPKAQVPAVPKRPTAPKRPSTTERPTATSSTFSHVGPSMFSQLQQG